MARDGSTKDLSLKALELFQICARKGSLQDVSDETGLAVSTVSHHLRNLETHLGVALFDHTRRPMVLTPKGAAFLRTIDDALYSIRKAKAEASAGGMAQASYLRIGSIEDFDSDIIPELAVYLSDKMPRCDFLYHTDSSHALIDMLRDRKLDLGITSYPSDRYRDLMERPLLRDPFVVVLPRGAKYDVKDVVEGRSDLPLLRFSGSLLIGRLIEAQLRRLGVAPPLRFECANDRTLMAMVAAGAGWAITTPLLFSRARRFQSDLRMHAFPAKRFARTLSIVATPDCSRSVLDQVDARVRELITQRTLRPMTQSAPWLAEEFLLIE